MPSQAGFWSVEDRLRELSAQGDPLEQLQRIVDFELFRSALTTAMGRVDRARGGRPPFDAVLKFKMLYLQAQHGLSFEQTEHLVRDRLSWMRFCGLSIADPVPDANTLWDFREVLIAAGAFETLFEQLDEAIKDAGYIPMGGQIVDASLVAAPRQRNTDVEKEAIKSDGTVQSDLTIPEYGYKTHISIDVEHGFIRRQKTTDAAAQTALGCARGWSIRPTRRRVLGRIPLTAQPPTRRFWPIEARSARSIARSQRPSRCRSGQRRPMPRNPRSAPASSTSSPSKKERMHLFIRSIGIKSAKATVAMANIAYNLGRWRWWETRTASA